MGQKCYHFHCFNHFRRLRRFLICSLFKSSDNLNSIIFNSLYVDFSVDIVEPFVAYFSSTIVTSNLTHPYIHPMLTPYRISSILCDLGAIVKVMKCVKLSYRPVPDWITLVPTDILCPDLPQFILSLLSFSTFPSQQKTSLFSHTKSVFCITMQIVAPLNTHQFYRDLWRMALLKKQ